MKIKKPIIIICWNSKVKILYCLVWSFDLNIKININNVSTRSQSNKLPSWFPQVPDILYNKGFVVWEWLKTVSLLKSEFTNDATKPRKLKITKKSWKKVKEIILLFKIFESLKFFKDNKTIRKDNKSPKTKE